MRFVVVTLLASCTLFGPQSFAADGRKASKESSSSKSGCTEKDDYLDKAIEEANTACKSKMTIGYTAGTGFEGDQLKPVADGINYACTDGNDGFVAKKIKRVCAEWDMKLKKVDVTLKGTTLHVRTNNEIDNSPDAVRCKVSKIVGGKLPKGIDCQKHF